MLLYAYNEWKILTFQYTLRIKSNLHYLANEIMFHSTHEGQLFIDVTETQIVFAHLARGEKAHWQIVVLTSELLI